MSCGSKALYSHPARPHSLLPRGRITNRNIYSDQKAQQSKAPAPEAAPGEGVRARLGGTGPDCPELGLRHS